MEVLKNKCTSLSKFTQNSIIFEKEKIPASVHIYQASTIIVLLVVYIYQIRE